MSEKTPPIPPDIWAKIVAFLREDKDGGIYLRVRGGRVKDADIMERSEVKSAVYSQPRSGR